MRAARRVARRGILKLVGKATFVLTIAAELINGETV